MIYLDVRTPEEYAEGHVPGAINIPVQTLVEDAESQISDKSTEIQVYCRSGARAEAAKQALNSLGYSNVTNQGGISWWDGELNTGMQP